MFYKTITLLILLAVFVRSCPDIDPDITWKAYNSELILEATARSRSSIRNNSYGVTFDLIKFIKGMNSLPVLFKNNNKQFRIGIKSSNNNNCSSGSSGQGQMIKTGRRYILFLKYSTTSSLVSVYSPVPLNRRNSRVVIESICHECGEFLEGVFIFMVDFVARRAVEL